MRASAVAVAVVSLCSCAPSGETRAGAGTPPADSAVPAPPPVPVAMTRVMALLEPALRARDALPGRLRPDSGTSAADSAFLEARGDFAVAIDSVGSAVWSDEALQTWVTGDPAAADSAKAAFTARGLRLTWSEGSAYPSEDTGAWLRIAGPYLTAPMREYLARRDHDEAQGFTDDAALRIPWDSLAERIARWDRFIERHPGFVLLREAEMWRGIFLRTYLTGIDNSRVFDDTLVTEVRGSYERFVALHGATRTGRLVAGYLEVLRLSGGKETDAVRSYRAAHGIGSMIGMQPPVR